MEKIRKKNSIDYNEGHKDRRRVFLPPDTSPKDVSQNPSPASGATSTESSNQSRQWNDELGEGIWDMGEQIIGEEFPMKELPCKSETEESLTTETKESKETSAASSEALSNVYSKLSPFTLTWSFGINRKVDLINLTTADAFQVFYVSAHFGVIYDYVSDAMTFLPGHNYPITSTAADATGRWLVTADAGEDTVIIIWDKKRKLPVWSLYNVFPDEGVRHVGISQDGRFLAAINDQHPRKLKFWLWTYGRENPDGVVLIDPTIGKAKHIDFNHVKTEQMVVTMEHTVVFCEWNGETRELLDYTPELDEKRRRKIGTLRESIFLDDNHSTISSTSQGYVVVWSDVNYNEIVDPEKPGGINRDFLKALKFHKTGITSLCLCDKIIATGSEDGHIFFHDEQFRLMYWMPGIKLDPLLSVSFNIEPIPYTSDPFSFEISSEPSENEQVEQVHNYDSSLDNENSETELGDDSVSEDIRTETKSLYAIPQPTDCTLGLRPIVIRDFIFLTATGKIGYVSQRREKIKYYLRQLESPILSLDCSPTKSHLALGNSVGQLVLYDHSTKKALLSTSFANAITMLKYSVCGQNLMSGFQNGDLFMLDSLLLTVKIRFETSKGCIRKLCFSPRNDLFAFFDANSVVQVFKKKPLVTQWLSMGKYNSHYKPIVDILFEKHPDNPKMCRLFTIGQDRVLVEYDMKNLEENKLKILSTMRIEQTAIPQCFICIGEFYKTPHFLVSNDEYKLKVLDAENYTCRKTTLGPTADTPIKFMKVIQQPEGESEKGKMVYVTDKHIGIRVLPPTGNPFEGMGMVAHPEKLFAVAVSHDNRYIFTVGVNDLNPLMWELNPDSVDVAFQLGGTGLEPYVSLIEGGPNSFLFKEIEDFFYYAQIIHQGENPNQSRSVSKNLALCEIPDLFRALGYYPTDYEVDNLLLELKHMGYEETGQLRTEISFEECVMAFLNHRPVRGASLADINNALLAIADLSDPSDIIIERSELYRALEEKAEAMEHAEVVGYLCILLLPKDEQNPVPHNICLNEFAEFVLGIDLTITEDNVRQITHAFEHQSHN